MPTGRKLLLTVADQLVAVNPAIIGAWQEALRPVADRLVAPLAEICVDPQRVELSRSLATSLLADYAKHDVTTLATLVMDGDVSTFSKLFPVLEQHGDAAVRSLRAVLACVVEPTWNDSPLDPAWNQVLLENQVELEAGHGMLADRFAFCQDLPWEAFTGVAEALDAAGYRPTRVRPYRHPISCWWRSSGLRDGGKWRLESDLTAEQLAQLETTTATDGLLPCDVAGYPAAHRQSAGGYALCLTLVSDGGR